MKTPFEELESPYLNEQIHSRTPPDQSGVGLEYEIVTSPFVDSLEFREEEARAEPDEAEGPEEAEWEERVEESPEVELWTAETDETDLLESTHAIDEADDQELEELYGEPSTAAEEEEDGQFEQETYATLNRELKSLSLESRESSYEDRVEDKEEEDSWEEQSEHEGFEFDVASGTTTAITWDFSLKGLANGTVGHIPEAMRDDVLSGRDRDLWNVTNRVFWDKHPDLTNQSLDPKNPKHRAWIGEYGQMANHVRALIWLTQIVELLDKYRGDLPREFLLGWMAKESDGRVGVTTSLGERGYFQIHPDEAKEVLGLKDADFRRTSTNREFSIQQGIRLVQAHRTNITSNYSVTDPSELLWQLTKTRHGLPGLLKSILDRLKKDGKDIEWAVVSAKMRAAGDRGVVRNVEDTMQYASNLKALADLIPAAPVATPELEEQFGDFDDFDEETGVIGDDDRKQVKNTFQSPYQWICRVSAKRDGKEVDFGTGFLISDRHVLTAAHVVYDAYKDWSFHELSVRVALNWDKELGEYGAAEKPRLPAKYKSVKGNSPFDYALITLSDSPGSKKFSQLKGKTLGHFAQASVAARDIQGATGYTAGYPGEKDRSGRKMYGSSGRLNFPGDQALEAAPYLQYAADTTKGQSGSPVWLKRENGIQLVGICSVASEKSNTVLRLTSTIWTQINAWMSGNEGEEEQESCASDPEYELAVTEVEEERENLEDFEEPEFSYETPLMAKAVTARPASSPPASCAERSTVNTAQSLKEPVPRPCCAFHPNLQPIGNQALDINDAAPHFYGENKYPHPEKSGFIYTCRGGFVDLGHSRDWLDWTGYLAVHAKALLPAGGTLELTCEFGSTRTVKFKAQGEKRSDEVCVYLAQRIAYQLAVWHEIVTSLLGHRYTAFSPEDNYSNLLGTYMGRDALMTFRKKPFNEAAALGIKSWLTKLGAVSQSQTMSAFNKVKDDWWKDVDLMTLNDLLLKRHFDAIGPVKPWLVPGVCSAASPFPLPVPNTVETPVRPGEKVKTDLKKLYVLELGTGPQVGPKLAGTKWDGKVHVTPDEFDELIQHVKTVL